MLDFMFTVLMILAGMVMVGILVLCLCAAYFIVTILSRTDRLTKHYYKEIERY